MTGVLDAVTASRVVPVVEIDDAGDAVPLARALLAGGLRTIEVTLRTPAALEAIRAVTAEVPDIVVGAGTVLDAGSVRAAHQAGAAFLVAPGSTRAVIDEAAALAVPLIPGAVTATEVMTALGSGLRLVKFFPAATSGGLAAVRALAAPFVGAGVRFVPTGGIDAAALASYLAEPAVAAVGGSWIARRTQIRAQRFDEITAAARDAAQTARRSDTEEAAA